jgi:plasmid replication initiation protein
MNIYLKQASNILNNIKSQNKEFRKAYILITKIDRKSSINDLVNSPTLQNVINILAPYVTNYQIREVVKLLQEFLKDLRSRGKYIRY